MLIERSYYQNEDVVALAKDLIGKYLLSHSDGKLTGGFITETEAYAGVTDMASHAYGGRRTSRTEIMYRQGGIAYVYLCYGVHSLFNIVTNKKDIPHAILIRGLKPEIGLDHMQTRTGKNRDDLLLLDGPGKVSLAMGILVKHTGLDLCRKNINSNQSGIWLEDRGVNIKQNNIISGTRIGVHYADKDAGLPYRFILNKKTPVNLD